MLSRIFVLFFLLVGSVEPQKEKVNQYAVLVSSGDGYDQQADICHAYQILHGHGIPEENIVTIMKDDWAYHKDNKKKGQLFNHPNGTDVYAGVKIDYRLKDVSKGNFLNVLLGNKTGVTGGTGRVLESSENDNVFLYYSGHGGHSLIAFPNHEPVFANELLETLAKMRELKMYKKMVIYLESCDSGSMFTNLDPKLGIFAVTSSNETVGSKPMYCATFKDICDGPICLGGRFSVEWMEDTDRVNMQQTTLRQQFETVKLRTDNSPVSSYGDKSFLDDKLSEFQGPKELSKVVNGVESYEMFSSFDEETDSDISLEDVNLWALELKIKNSPGRSAETIELIKQVQEIKNTRKAIEEIPLKLVKAVLPKDTSEDVVCDTANSPPNSDTNPKCYKAVVEAFIEKCSKMGNSDYRELMFTSLANLCNLNVPAEDIIDAMVKFCY